ncbi:MAG: hypothetical protein FGM57_01750 [Candidatus Taylorbacteria bacterium]|nr:hypothetical protein [Candidatus Taylorbacteria bacterium]
MSHHIYQTKAYIIESGQTGEASKKLLMLTDNLGLIYVAAQGVRLSTSKLKASIQDYSFSRVSLVRGKEIWRLTNAEKLISLYDKRLPIQIKRLCVEMLLFVKRLTPQDVPVSDVFNLVNTCASFCFQEKQKVIEYISETYMYFQVQLLNLLGYCPVDPVLGLVTAPNSLTTDTLVHIREYRTYIQGCIDGALHESHL